MRAELIFNCPGRVVCRISDKQAPLGREAGFTEFASPVPATT